MSDIAVDAWLENPRGYSWLTLLLSSLRATDELVSRQGNTLNCRRIRGRDSRTSATLLQELSTSLQIPDFVANWDALDEDIQDLSWLPGDILLVFGDSNLLLCDESKWWRPLLEILTSAHNEWQQGRRIEEGGTGEKRFFGAVFQCERASVELVLKHFEQSGLKPAVIDPETA